MGLKYQDVQSMALDPIGIFIGEENDGRVRIVLKDKLGTKGQRATIFSDGA